MGVTENPIHRVGSYSNLIKMNLNIKKGNCEVTIAMDCGSEVNNTIHPDNLKKVDPSNPDNPFEEVAQLHDYAMKRIFITPKTKVFDQDQVLEQLNDIIQKYPTTSTYLKHIRKYDAKEVMEEIGDQLAKPYNVNFLYPPTPEQTEYLPPFLRDVVVWLYQLVDNFDKTTESLVDYVQKVVDYEHKIMQSDLESDIKDATLISTAIMRHSSITYLEYFNQGGNDDSGTNTAKKCQCKKVARVAIADAIGALTGIPGGAAGVVVGAVVGSGKQLIKELG